MQSNPRGNWVLRGAYRLGALGLGLVLPAMPAGAQETAEGASGWYLSFDVGPALKSDAEVPQFLRLFDRGTIEFEPGVDINLSGGYAVRPWLLLELRTGMNYHGVDRWMGDADVNAALWDLPLMANVVIQCTRPGAFKPFIGGGAGGVLSILDVDDTLLVQDLAFVTLRGTPSDLVFGISAFGGFVYEWNDRLSLSAQYRFQWHEASTWEFINEFGIEPTSDIEIDALSTHSLTFGFRYRF